MTLIDKLLATGGTTLLDVAPLVAVLVFYQLAILRRRLVNPRRVLLGLVYVIVGLTFFLVGLEEALFPLGKSMAGQLSEPAVHAPSPGAWRDFGLIYAFAATIGFALTLAEPALIAVALKAETVSGGAIPSFGLRVAVALGVAIGVTVGCLRIILGAPIPLVVLGAYAIIAFQTFTAPRLILSLAYDVGIVTTSTVTVPVVTALGLGLAASVPGRSPLLDGFGLIAFASLFPIMTVMAYAWLARYRGGGRAGGKRRGEP